MGRLSGALSAGKPRATPRRLRVTTTPRRGGASADSSELQRLTERSLHQGTRTLYADPGLYDRLYGRRKRDIEFYVELARRRGGPVLELGVGTGRVAAALAAADIDVVGIDLMSEMLQKARERLARLPAAQRQHVVLRRGDMRRLRVNRRFALVFAPFNAFMHLYSRSDLEKTLEVCRRHLKPDGRLAFDVLMPDLPALLQDPERLYACGSVVDPKDGQRYRHFEASHYDPVSQVRTVTMLFESDDASVASRAVPLTQRQFFPAELEALLLYNGFEIEARHGGFGSGPIELRAESQVVVARVRKPRHPQRRRR
jgi:SAM-dependent methyltransferase